MAIDYFCEPGQKLPSAAPASPRATVPVIFLRRAPVDVRPTWWFGADLLIVSSWPDSFELVTEASDREDRSQKRFKGSCGPRSEKRPTRSQIRPVVVPRTNLLARHHAGARRRRRVPRREKDELQWITSLRREHRSPRRKHSSKLRLWVSTDWRSTTPMTRTTSCIGTSSPLFHGSFVPWVISGSGSVEDEDGKVLDLGPGCRLQAPAGYLQRALAGTNARLVIGTDLPSSEWTSPLNKKPADRPAALSN